MYSLYIMAHRLFPSATLLSRLDTCFIAPQSFDMCMSSLRKIGTCVLETYLGVMWHLFFPYITSFTEDDVHYIHIPLRRLQYEAVTSFTRRTLQWMIAFLLHQIGSTVIHGSVPHQYTYIATSTVECCNWHIFFSEPPHAESRLWAIICCFDRFLLPKK